MFVPGLKSVVQSAIEQRKFLTNGQALPEIDFSQPVHLEITAIDSAHLVSMIRCTDDTVVDFGKEYMRVLYLQMTHDCIFQDAVVALLSETPALAELLTGMKKVRVSITGYTTRAKQTFRKPVLRNPNEGKHIQHWKVKLEDSAILVAA
jgi:hypothetical protein